MRARRSTAMVDTTTTTTTPTSHTCSKACKSVVRQQPLYIIPTNHWVQWSELYAHVAITIIIGPLQ